MKHWRPAALWLGFLAPFFYLTYGLSNHLAALRTDVPTFAFDWERHVPFLPWTIFPYWSINAFYGLSLFLCRTPLELGRHARRLLTAQVVAVTCFLLWPLKLGVTRPESDGAAGWLFHALASFDQPYNQAPSLHIALLVILWDLYRRILPRQALPLMHGWALLIGISVLTTWQHHFIDIPTGAALGLACVWLWPLEGTTPRPAPSRTSDPRRRDIGLLYAIGAAIAIGITLLEPRMLWPLGWLALALAIVAANYLVLGAEGFQKSADGRVSWAIRWLLAPYHFAAWLNSRAWTRGEPAAVAVADGVWLGRWPGANAPAQFPVVLSLAPELASRPSLGRGNHPHEHLAFPALDLIPIDTPMLTDLADRIEATRTRAQPVLVCCALGYGRSVAAVLAWLLRTRRADTVDAAMGHLRTIRPNMVVSARQRAELAAVVPRA